MSYSDTISTNEDFERWTEKMKIHFIKFAEILLSLSNQQAQNDTVKFVKDTKDLLLEIDNILNAKFLLVLPNEASPFLDMPNIEDFL